ncbi:MAG: transketolase [Alphaproteobacteria bacterium TMED93]|nr:MAG: transketolase [Alphaproteobacteria bacterium TMED93]
MRRTFINHLTELAKENKNIFLLVGDVGYNVVEKFKNYFPDRFLNVGVAEQNMTSIAAGLASEGYHVFTYSIANFPTFRCAEQIRNDVDYHNLPVTVVSVGGGVGYGNLGYSHHAIQDYGLMRMMPNFKIASPGDLNEVKSVLNYLTKNPQPSYLRLGINNEHKYTVNKKNIIPGKWYPLSLNKGHENVVLSTGTSLKWVMNNIERFKNKDIFTLPIWGMSEKKKQRSIASKFSSIITVEDHLYDCGFGSWLIESLQISGTNRKIQSLALPIETTNMVSSEENILKKMKTYN